MGNQQARRDFILKAIPRTIFSDAQFVVDHDNEPGLSTPHTQHSSNLLHEIRSWQNVPFCLLTSTSLACSSSPKLQQHVKLSENRLAWEQWRLEIVPGRFEDGKVRVFLVDVHGHCLQAHSNGNVLTSANRLEWEQWIVDNVPDKPGWLMFRSAHGTVLSTDMKRDRLCQVPSPVASSSSSDSLPLHHFRLSLPLADSNQRVFIVTAHGTALSCQADGSVVSVNERGPAEEWFIADTGAARIALISALYPHLVLQVVLSEAEDHKNPQYRVAAAKITGSLVVPSWRVFGPRELQGKVLLRADLSHLPSLSSCPSLPPINIDSTLEQLLSPLANLLSFSSSFSPASSSSPPSSLPSPSSPSAASPLQPHQKAALDAFVQSVDSAVQKLVHDWNTSPSSASSSTSASLPSSPSSSSASSSSSPSFAFPTASSSASPSVPSCVSLPFPSIFSNPTSSSPLHLQCDPSGRLSLNSNTLSWERFSLVPVYHPSQRVNEHYIIDNVIKRSKSEQKHLENKDQKAPAVPSSSPSSSLTFLSNPTSSQGRWRLVWSDEFGGDTLNKRYWNVEHMPDPPNQELQYYTTRCDQQEGANVGVQDGRLWIEARYEPMHGKRYTSGRLTTQHKVALRYGRIEAKILLPKGTGCWPAFWMLGSNLDDVGWPRCGEIDIMEGKGRETNFTSSALHRGPHPDCNVISHHGHHLGAEYDLSRDWHVYSVEWSPGEIVFLFDEHPLFRMHRESHISADRLGDEAYWPFDKGHPFFLILNLAIGGWFDAGHEVDNQALPQRLQVQYVRAYQREAQ